MVTVSRRARITIPLTTFDHNWKVTLGSSDEEVTSNLMSLNCTSRSLRYGIGDFNIPLLNFKGEYNTKAKIGETIKIYFHHDTSTPTNNLFIGKLDGSFYGLNSNNKSYIVLRGRDFPELADKKITVSFSNAQCNNAIKYIIDTWFSGKFTYSNIHANMTGSVNGDYIDQKAINVISDLLNQVEYDGYIDENRDIHTYPDDGTNKNETESIVHGTNMLPYSGFGRDGLKEFNEVKCYGDQTDDLTLFRRKIDQTSIDESWEKTMIINSRSLSNPESVASRAYAELTDLKRDTFSGSLLAEAGLPTLKPSQYIWCSSQYGEIENYYKVISVTHLLDAIGRITCNVSLEKPVKSIVKMIRTMENSLNSQNKNPNDMHDTLIYLTFDNEEGIISLGDLEISDGTLKLKSGKTTGTLTTEIVNADSNISHFEVRANVNDDCSLSTFKVSNNGGATYNSSNQSYNLVGDREKPISFTTTGNQAKVTITLQKDSDNPIPELRGFCMLAKRG